MTGLPDRDDSTTATILSVLRDCPPEKRMDSLATAIWCFTRPEAWSRFLTGSASPNCKIGYHIWELERFVWRCIVCGLVERNDSALKPESDDLEPSS